MRISRSLVTALVAFSVGAALVGQRGQGTPIKAGEECPPGMTEVRPGNCQAPTMPTPSIVDYRPHSTLVTAGHPVPRAKFPAIDFHGHPMNRINSADALATMVSELDQLNVGLMVAADNLSGERLRQAIGTIA